MLKDLINEYREIMLDPVIDAMNEEIKHTNDLDKKKEIQHKIDALISAWDETARDTLNDESPISQKMKAIDNIAFENIQNRELLKLVTYSKYWRNRSSDKD